MIDIREVISDADLSQEFTVLRSTGSFVKGKWTIENVEEITMIGTVTNPNPKDLLQLPEGDRVEGTVVFHSVEPLYITRVGAGTKKNPNGISDKVTWRNENYKLSSVLPYIDYGYYRAVGVRIKGD